MRYTFADCELDTQLYTLRRTGQLLQLRPKVFQVLLYLVEHRHQVVTKQALLEHVWPQQFISEATLENCIKDVRQVLGDTGRAQRLIRTLRGYGYRFVAAIEAHDAAPRDWAPDDESATARPASSTLRPEPEAAHDDDRETDARVEAVSPRHSALTSAEEWKLVTVLCCALAEPPLGASRELEPHYSALRALAALVQDTVQRYGGTMQPVVGDQVLAVFGAPLAQEDHARCAVLAALDLQQHVRIPALGAGLAIRMGAHSGPVVVGELGSAAHGHVTAIGTPTQGALRLQQQAVPGTLLVSAATYHLVQEEVRGEPCGSLVLDEWQDALPVYVVQELLQRRGGVPQRTLRGRSPFVGRQRELALLHDRWAAARAGAGQVLSLVGPPGMGKTRLLTEFGHSLPPDQVTWALGQCLAYGQATPYLPVRDLVQHICTLAEGDPLEMRQAAVQRRLAALGGVAEEDVALVLQLLDLPVAPEILTRLTPEARQARTFALLGHLIRHEAQRQPLVLAVENMHWIDPTSEAWLVSLVAWLAGTAVLLIMTYRPGYQPPWGAHAAMTQLAVPPLRAEDSQAIVAAVPGTTQLPMARCMQIVAHGAGNPFFVEELAWHAVEHNLSATPVPLPATVHAVLAARLDRLPPVEKRLLQTAAVIGHDIPLRVLQAVAELSAEALQQGLTHLQAAEFLYATSLFPEPVYTFKHALTHEVAYNAVLLGQRRVWHERAGQAIEALWQDRLPEHYHTLAYHYSRSGNTTKAVDYLHRAGHQAVERSAYAEAVSHVTAALDLLPTLPDTPERTRHELDLQLTLGPALMITKGFTDPEVVRVYTRARTLCQQIGESPQLFLALWGLWRFYGGRGEHQTARELGEQLLALAECGHDPMLLVQACHALGPTLFALGELVPAQARLAQGIARYDPQLHRASLRYGGHDPGSCCQSFAAVTLCVRGYPDQALHQGQEALRLAQELAHPHTLTVAMDWVAWLHQFRREGPATQALAETAMTISSEHGIVHQLVLENILRGWALAVQGQGEAGIAQMREGVAAWRALGEENQRPYQLLQLAELYGAVGQAAAGLRVLAEARAAVPHREGRFFAAELLRLEGELRLTCSPAHHAEVETCFRQALAIAGHQQAKSLELRAATSLARLWQRQGKGAAARELLAPVYGWFTEGFATADLQDAKTLLDELAR